jgi:hypothetical protein
LQRHCGCLQRQRFLVWCQRFQTGAGAKLLLSQDKHREHQVNYTRKYLRLFWTLVLGFGLMFSSGCSTEFFVDKGHVDWVGGISFDIKPPYLNEKKAFNLRGENLSLWQLQQISEAMPFIAAFTNAQLGNGIARSLLPASEIKLRSIREIQNLNLDTFLAVKTIQNWQVTAHQIQFNIDYFYTGRDGYFVYYRDNYIFKPNNRKWAFEKHAKTEPEGILVCDKSPQGWRVCVPLNRATAD